MPVTTIHDHADRPPTYRCQGCGEYLWPEEVKGHHQTGWAADGTPFPLPCGPIDPLPEEEPDV